ncbi:MAG: D-alanine--D-alanine ligase family protein [Holophaga sp.]|nr:D-alanine--D-alanine ligase family protein [Holophaga sp.]
MSKPLIVGLLFGGESPEHEVSIVTARSIAQHLDPARFAVRPMGIARNGVWVMLGDPFARLSAGEQPPRSQHPFLPLEKGAELCELPDVFFNAIHGAGGEDGQLQGYLELLHRPYTGAGLLAMAAGMDKWITKRIWESEGLPVGPFVGLTEEQWRRSPDEVLNSVRVLGLPVFVKPANTGSSIGIQKIKNLEGIPKAIEDALNFDRRVLVERGIDAREIEIAVLGGDDPFVSVPGEILVAGEFYDFKDKYLDGKSSTAIPADLPGGLAERLRTYARAAFRSLDAYGMARMDFFLERGTNRIFLNEINLIPGFTSISMYPKLMEASGISYTDLLARLIELAGARHEQMKSKAHGFESGSNWFA